MNLHFVSVILIILFGTFNQILFAQAKDVSPILPSPVVYKRVKGNLYLPKKLSLNKSEYPENIRSQFDVLLEKFHKLNTVDTTGKAFIRLRKLKNVPKDFYSIAVNDYLLISYSNEKSLFYALESLIQLIQTEDDIKYIPKAFIQDYPKFEWRGLHLDVSRHFFTVDEIKKYLDLMAFYKLNTFHWHLTDDQGWRIEIKAFPKLTSIGAYRDSTVSRHFTSQPREYNKEKYGGFYTQDEIKEIVSYAKQRYISIVPEIEMPGHSRAALAAYPEFSCNNIQKPVPGLWGVYDDIYCTKEESFQFIESILEEVVNLFPGEYIHIGGDEAPKTRWKHCENCQNRIKENNLKNEEALQSFFINRIDRFLSKKNKKIIGWDEILEGGLSPNAAVMSWRGMKGGIDAAKKSHYVVMTPGSHCYFDHYQSKSKDEPLAIGGYTPLEKVYDFNPIPSELNTNESSFILGAQANLWTEYIPNLKQLEYMAYPRAIALSQSLWCHDRPSYNSFFKTLTETHFLFLDLLNVNYSRSSLKPNIDIASIKNGISIKVNAHDSLDSYKTQIIENDTIVEVFDLKSGQPLSIKSTEKNMTMTDLKFTSTKNNISSGIRIMRHLGLGATTNYITEPNPQYNYNKSLLTDGQYGARPWRGHEWIGFDSSEIVFEIELATKKKVKNININFLKSNGSWIYLPNKVLIYKKRTKRWRLCKSRKVKNEKTKFKINRRIRKLRFVIRTHEQIPTGLPGAGHTPWTFIDEIEFQ